MEVKLPSTAGARPPKKKMMFLPKVSSWRRLPLRKPSPTPASSSSDPTPQAMPNMVRNERNLCAHRVRKVCPKVSRSVRIGSFRSAGAGQPLPISIRLVTAAMVSVGSGETASRWVKVATLTSDMCPAGRRKRSILLSLLSRSCDRDCLDIHELADAVGRKLASMPGVFDPAERDAGIGGDHLVDEHHTAFEFVDEPFALVLVGGPGAGAEPEAAVVGQVDGFVDIFDAEEHRDRAEKFFAVGGRFFRDIG